MIHKDLHGQQSSQLHQQSLGVDLHTTVDSNLVSHHTVSHIDPLGPVGARHIVAVGDELLEVNGQALRGLERDQAISIVRETPTVVRLVVCQPLPDKTDEDPAPDGQVDDMESLETEDASNERNSIRPSIRPDVVVSPSNDSDGDHAPDVNEEMVEEEEEEKFQGPKLPLPAIDYLVGDFTRRFERQSWRERHEEERRRLKQKFEVSLMVLCDVMISWSIVCVSF